MSLQNLNDLTVSLSEGLADIAVQQCLCDFTSDAFQDSDLTCSSYSHQLIFLTAIVYSTPTGDKTASTVINSLQNWLDRNPQPVVGTGMGSFAVIKEDCPLLVSDPIGTGPSCATATPTLEASNGISVSPVSEDSSGGVSIGITFAAGLLIGLLVMAITL